MQEPDDELCNHLHEVPILDYIACPVLRPVVIAVLRQRGWCGHQLDPLHQHLLVLHVSRWLIVTVCCP